MRLVVLVDTSERHSPLELRQRFLDAIRESIMRASAAGRIDQEIAAELWRALPEREPSR